MKKKIELFEEQISKLKEERERLKKQIDIREGAVPGAVVYLCGYAYDKYIVTSCGDEGVYALSPEADAVIFSKYDDIKEVEQDSRFGDLYLYTDEQGEQIQLVSVGSVDDHYVRLTGFDGGIHIFPRSSSGLKLISRRWPIK